MNKAQERIKEINKEIETIPKHYASRYVLELEKQGILLGIESVLEELKSLYLNDEGNDWTYNELIQYLKRELPMEEED